VRRFHNQPLIATTMSDTTDGHGTPRFHQMSREDALALLARHHVGRLAFTFRDRVDIQPIHYVYEDGFVYGRTSEGAKLDTIAHNRWVALETDEVSGVFDWKSVVVHGAFYRLELEGGTVEGSRLAQHAVALLGTVIPATLRPGDPVEFRTVLFRISVDEISGRASYRT
jgi:nitroimidazol reductase NimA-like FMN-containing flavoprotein (pyridoxamine 5'-phosphate oxidase superfamily)